MKNPVGWFEIYVDDMARAKTFYETVFGDKLDKLEGDLEMWSFAMDQAGGGAAGALVKMPGFPVGRNSTLVYFKTDECGAVAQKAKAAGGRIEKEKMSIGPYGFIALVNDTEGNMIGLHSMK